MLYLNRGGWVGVDLFFVLSGFLVSGLLFREWQRSAKVSIGRFLLRRGLKIYPAFWALMIWTGCLLALNGLPPGFRIRHLVGELLFFQNYLGSLWAHTWSLAVEEHFYLILALLVAAAVTTRAPSSTPFKFIPFMFIWLAGACLVFRIVTALALPGYTGRLIFYATHVRIDALMFGVLLSYYWHFRWSARTHERLYRWRHVMILGGIVCLLPAFLLDYAQHRSIIVFGLTVFYLAGGALLLGFLMVFKTGQARWLRFISFLGAHSYSVYLWHFCALAWTSALVSRLIPASCAWYVYGPLAFMMMWALGILAAKLVELPVLRVRDRFFPSTAK